MTSLLKCLASACLSLVVAAGCSSSESSTPSGAADAGGADDASTPMAHDGSAVADAAPLPDGAVSSANCGFAVSGDRTYPMTDGSSCQGSLTQHNGSGDYTINMATGFASPATMESLTFGLLVTSTSPPAVGDTWTVGQDGRGGNSTLTVIKGATGLVWGTSDTDAALVKGGTTVTFTSVTKVMGTQNPQDVFYLFDVTFQAALNGQSPGTAPLKVTGHFKVTSLPLGA